MKNGTNSHPKNKNQSTAPLKKRQREEENALIVQEEASKKIKLNPVEVDVDRTFVDDRLNVSQLHMAALQGNIRKIRLLIKNGASLDCKDNEDETPLFYALRANQMSAFVELLSQGSDYFLVNKTAIDIPCLALYLKFNNKIDKDFYKAIKSAFGISDESKIKILRSLKREIKEALKLALASGKKLLIMIGEIHNSLRIYQIEKAIFKIANNLGITVGYAERPDYTDFYNPLRKKMKEECDYTFYPVDTGRIDNSLSVRSFRYRERSMAKEIKIIDEAGIFVTGCVHLRGFFNSFKNSNQYQILPINLSALENYELDLNNDRYQFAMDDASVIQVDENGSKGTNNLISKKWYK